ncbi:hypothetical protein JTB14_002603 [Gonioctena quinquepunctata]|nr:hypothetical protein JTB14_002603 [Gonioctena quinquepunctata]
MGFLNGRALHYVFKIPDRKETMRFYKDVLGMQVLRHEEFADGCEATCNGPYANRWSKTMIGYGPEDTHFVMELTYNYGIHSYEKGNDFVQIAIKTPGGYNFEIIDEPWPKIIYLDIVDPVQKVTLACSNLAKSKEYWNGVLGLEIFGKTGKSLEFGFKKSEPKLELVDIGQPINRAKAYGRIAFSTPHAEQEILNKKIEEAKQTVITPLISLDTPGKATVRVLILADPDGHEICFVDDENYRQLSQPDPDSERVLEVQMRVDKS